MRSRTASFPACRRASSRRSSWMLAVRPNQRPQSGEQLRAVLDGQAQIPPRAPPGTTIPGALAHVAAGAQIEQAADATRINTAYLPTHMPPARTAPAGNPNPTTFSPTTSMPTARATPVPGAGITARQGEQAPAARARAAPLAPRNAPRLRALRRSRALPPGLRQRRPRRRAHRPRRAAGPPPSPARWRLRPCRGRRKGAPLPQGRLRSPSRARRRSLLAAAPHGRPADAMAPAFPSGTAGRTSGGCEGARRSFEDGALGRGSRPAAWCSQLPRGRRIAVLEQTRPGRPSIGAASATTSAPRRRARRGATAIRSDHRSRRHATSAVLKLSTGAAAKAPPPDPRPSPMRASPRARPRHGPRHGDDSGAPAASSPYTRPVGKPVPSEGHRRFDDSRAPNSGTTSGASILTAPRPFRRRQRTSARVRRQHATRPIRVGGVGARPKASRRPPPKRAATWDSSRATSCLDERCEEPRFKNLGDLAPLILQRDEHQRQNQ